MAQQVSLDIIARQPSGDNNALTSCPYLTNVGATKVYPGKTVFDPESAVVDPAGHPYFNEIKNLRVSAHLLIRRDGSLLQFVPFRQRA